MPRKGRGGARQGAPGATYANRTDLNANHAQAGMTPEGFQSPASGGVQPQAPVQPMMRTPDDSPNLLDPTNFPDEPVTAGLRSGPGPGPEVLGLTRPDASLSGVLEKLALATDSPQVRSMLAVALRKGW